MQNPDLATATAHRHWDGEWGTEAGRAAWLAPDPAVVAALPLLAARGVRRALDLGCGIGRHALLLAAEGYEAHGLDAAPAGLAHLRASARERDVPVTATRAAMTALPFAAASFDLVVAFNVVYHGEPAVVRRALHEVVRVLRPGGLYLGTMLSKRNGRYGQGRAIAPDTFVIDEVSDKAHPHFYCDAAGLLALHAGLEPLRLEDREHGTPGSWHWHLLAERRP